MVKPVNIHLSVSVHFCVKSLSQSVLVIVPLHDDIGGIMLISLSRIFDPIGWKQISIETIDEEVIVWLKKTE